MDTRPSLDSTRGARLSDIVTRHTQYFNNTSSLYEVSHRFEKKCQSDANNLQKLNRFCEKIQRMIREPTQTEQRAAGWAGRAAFFLANSLYVQFNQKRCEMMMCLAHRATWAGSPGAVSFYLPGLEHLQSKWNNYASWKSMLNYVLSVQKALASL